jgi:SNF2 family DNA or RNA helicase
MRYQIVKSISKFKDTEISFFKNCSIKKPHTYHYVSQKKLSSIKNEVFDISSIFKEDFKVYKVKITDITRPVKGIVLNYTDELQFVLKKFQINLLKPANKFDEIFVAFTDVNLSDNQFAPFGIPEIIEWPLFYEESTQISENLFEPLDKSKQKGKYFAEKEKSLKAGERQQPLFKDVEEEPTKKGPTKAYERHKNRYSTSVKYQDPWDLLYPILMPPLDYDFSDDLVYGELYDFQKTGVKFLMENKSALLADEMGTGKTVMSVVAMRALFKKAHIKRGLIVCPVSILNVWDEHISDWAPDLSFTVVRGTLEIREMDWNNPAHLYVTTYDTIRNDFLNTDDMNSTINENTISEFDFVLIDEAQYVKNPDSKRSKAIKVVDPVYRWALTGTPIENRIDDVVSIFDFLKPGYLSFKNEYTAIEIKQKIEPYFLRREKKDVFEDLPEKVKDNLWLELGSDQRREYDLFERGKINELKNMRTRVSSIHIFSVLNKLKQICNFASGRNKSSKTDALVDLVESIKSNNEKVLIFSQYNKEGVDKLENLLKKYGVVTFKGGMSDSQRNNAINRFKHDPDTFIFLANVKTGGLGLTLTEANYVVHFDHWWNPASMWQAEDRAHRKGQNKVVNVYSFWMKDTVEERIFNTLKKKGLLFEEIVSGLSEDDINSMITVEEWLEVLGVKSKDERDRMAENIRLKQDSQKIYEDLQRIDPLHFEEIVRRFFVKFGFINAKLTKASYDRGIDIVGSKESIGGIEKIIVQCKRMEIVGANFARELYGVLTSKAEVTKGYLVVSGRLSEECRRFCMSKGNLIAIDGITLAGYIKRYDINLN